MDDRLARFVGSLGASLKSLVKIAVESRGRTRVKAPEAPTLPLVVMGNGPSLNDTIADCRRQLEVLPLLAVNFAALSPEFGQLRPSYYVLADPVFFAPATEGNVGKLRDAFARIDWPVTLFVPIRSKAAAHRLTAGNANITVAGFNPVGVEGFELLEEKAFDLGLGMPRPRNVLIPSLMIAISLGFKTIYVAGADHSWMKTLDVTDDNTVVSVQPHFYAESNEEKARVTSVYKDVRLHEVVYSFYVAFKSYFTIERYARRRGVSIYNVTPGSFIDAFQRCNLATVSVRPE
ncbi:MAG: hypothetical protein K2K40_06155 [Paramuribaculum sp.]|nr:hypothetical protein [Paramuribaculum sp.]